MHVVVGAGGIERAERLLRFAHRGRASPCASSSEASASRHSTRLWSVGARSVASALLPGGEPPCGLRGVAKRELRFHGVAFDRGEAVRIMQLAGESLRPQQRLVLLRRSRPGP